MKQSENSLVETPPTRVSHLTIFDTRTHTTKVIHETSALIEAPNWTLDGQDLIVNGGGHLYRIAVDGIGGLEPVDTGTVGDSNNDHVLSPDGRLIYISSNDGHLYVLPIEGGQPRCVTDATDGLAARYLHGISPDGTTLAFIGLEKTEDVVRFNIYTAPSTGGVVTPLTDSIYHHDGSEYSPDGAFMYFNADIPTTLVPGSTPMSEHLVTQLFRMKPDGTDILQLTFDERVNWFPHLSPDGITLIYLSYEAGVRGHPANQTVELRAVASDGSDPRTLVTLTGGQGTINVNSWSPDSTRFAYVGYGL